MTLRCDEMRYFVGSKARKAWVWLAMEAAAGRIVRLHVGDRDAAAAKAFWTGLPEACRNRALCLTDRWEAYAAAIPPPRHLAVSKRSGRMNGLERFNNTVRLRLGRLPRKTPAFSKRPRNHAGCLRFFINDYNHPLAITWRGRRSPGRP